MVCCSLKTRLFTFSLVGLVIGLIGSILTIVWPTFFHKMLNSELALSKESLSFTFWEEIPVPIYLRFYMFNWTNYDKPNEIPNLVEMGPYTFKEHRIKKNYTWNDNNQTISYWQNRTWIFEQELSNGTMEDLVTTINVPAISATYAIRGIPTLVKIAVNMYLQFKLKTEHYVTKSVKEFLFDGYEDPILDLAEKFKKIVPVTIPFDKFGWFYTRNGSVTYDGYFNMETGTEDISRVGVLSNWNYAPRTDYFKSYCGLINGSAGEIFPPNRAKEDKLEIFVTDICRSISLRFQNDTLFGGSVPAYRYYSDPLMLANGTSNPDNWCFCGTNGNSGGAGTYSDTVGSGDPADTNSAAVSGDPAAVFTNGGDLSSSSYCHPDGVLNITTCKWGAPLFVSLPHFYHADPIYRTAVHGMSPGPQHQTFADLEPLSGIPLQVSAALQINVYIEPQKEFHFYKGLPNTKTFFPCFWFQENVNLDQPMISNVEHFLWLNGFGLIVAYVLIAIGLSTLLTIGVIFCTRCKSEDESLYLVSNNSYSTTTAASNNSTNSTSAVNA